MATSGSTDWTRTRDQIILRALRLIQVQDIEESSAPAAYVANCTEALNALVKSWQAKGFGRWLRTEGTLTLVAGQDSYTMGPGGDVTYRPQAIHSIRFRNSSSVDMPIESVSRDEYFDMPDKTNGGIPNLFYYDPQIPLGKLYVWPTLQSGLTGTLRITYSRSIEDFDAASNTPDMPVEWFNALTYNLAVDVAPEFGREPTTLVVARAAQYLSEAMAYDGAGGSVYFQPDLERYQ